MQEPANFKAKWMVALWGRQNTERLPRYRFSAPYSVSPLPLAEDVRDRLLLNSHDLSHDRGQLEV